MSDGYNFKKLKSEILKLSKARDWEIAKKEWALHSIYESDEFERCLCGHSPIKEICCLFNRITEKHADVGNVCVKKFLGIRSDLIFSALKRVRKDISKSLNADSITFFFEKKLLTNWEYDFLHDTMRKKSLSIKQINQRQRINSKVLKAVKERGFQGYD